MDKGAFFKKFPKGFRRSCQGQSASGSDADRLHMAELARCHEEQVAVPKGSKVPI